MGHSVNLTSLGPDVGLALRYRTDRDGDFALCRGLSLSVGLTLLYSLVLMQSVALVSPLSISVGGWGIGETAMIDFLAIVRVATSVAVSLSA